MKTFKIEMRKHEEYGELGLVINTGRGYFQPAMNGNQCAHDILEHPATPHSNGYADELMALGGVIAGRVDSGWHNGYGRIIAFEDIRSDISSLITADLQNDGDMRRIPCITRYVQDSDFMSDLREEVREGIKEGVAEFFCGENKIEEIRTQQQYNVTAITSWIVEGCRAWERRFKRYSDNYSIAVTLFNRIAAECDWFIKQSGEYEVGVLYVDFESATARIEQVWEEDL